MTAASPPSSPQAEVTEHFQPIPLRFGSSPLSRVAFKLRCVVDLQLGSIWSFIGPKLALLKGNLLDVGCGEMPYRTFLPKHIDYVGIDVPQAGAFSMQGHEEIISFDGYHIPFPDATFDTVLCTEVLEHSPEPAALIAEIGRVLKPGGTLIATVPFSARVHYAPHDFHRFSKYALAKMLGAFPDVSIEERGQRYRRLSQQDGCPRGPDDTPITLVACALAVTAIAGANRAVLSPSGASNHGYEAGVVG